MMVKILALVDRVLKPVKPCVKHLDRTEITE
jgi:hypothetical protein